MNVGFESDIFNSVNLCPIVRVSDYQPCLLLRVFFDHMVIHGAISRRSNPVCHDVIMQRKRCNGVRFCERSFWRPGAKVYRSARILADPVISYFRVSVIISKRDSGDGGTGHLMG